MIVAFLSITAYVVRYPVGVSPTSSLVLEQQWHSSYLSI
jgi:hypothetical protein